ncbi:MAG: hypothetical protein H6716_27865 [Polyangiaceae bacterium]|nr:hypothetical protein [Polyangiaceae bacterium]
MTVGTKLPDDSVGAGAAPTEASALAGRQRASGRVELGRNARLGLTKVPLKEIRGLHPAIRARDERLDHAPGQYLDLEAWNPESLDLLLCAAPPWVIERGATADRHFLIVAGGHVLPSLRRSLPPEHQIVVVLVDAKFTDRRWLQAAAMHLVASRTASAALSPELLLAAVQDAERAGAEFLKDRSASVSAQALGLGSIRPRS